MTGKKIQRALRDLNDYIDGDRQKLCDRLHDLELSHKRKVKLLKKIENYLEQLIGGTYRDMLLCEIDDELSFNGRINHRVKGGL